MLLQHECLPACCCGGAEGVEEVGVAAVLCCEEPLLGTNPPTGARLCGRVLSVCSLLEAEKGPHSQVVNQRLID